MQFWQFLILLVVVNSAIWVYFDSSNIRDRYHVGIGPRNWPPHTWAALVFLLWPIFLPLYLEERKRASLMESRQGPPPRFVTEGMTSFAVIFGLIGFGLFGYLLWEGNLRGSTIGLVVAAAGVFGGRRTTMTREVESITLGEVGIEQVGFVAPPSDVPEDDEGEPVNLDQWFGPSMARPADGRPMDPRAGAAAMGHGGPQPQRPSIPGAPSPAPSPTAPRPTSPEPAYPSAAGAVPTGAVPKGAVPTGAVPKGAVPTGAVPTGAVPTGAVPTGAVPTGAVPMPTQPAAPPPPAAIAPSAVPHGVPYTPPPPGQPYTPPAPGTPTAPPAMQAQGAPARVPPTTPQHQHQPMAGTAPAAPTAPAPAGAPAADPKATIALSEAALAAARRGQAAAPPAFPGAPPASSVPAPSPRIPGPDAPRLELPEDPQPALAHAPMVPPSPPSPPSGAAAPSLSSPQSPPTPRPQRPAAPARGGQSTANPYGYAASRGSRSRNLLPILIALLVVAAGVAAAWIYAPGLFGRAETPTEEPLPTMADRPEPPATDAAAADGAGDSAVDPDDPRERMRRWHEEHYLELMIPLAEALEEIDFDGLDSAPCEDLEEYMQDAERGIPTAPDPEIESIFRPGMSAFVMATRACADQDEQSWAFGLLQGKRATHRAQELMDERYGLAGILELELESEIGVQRSPESITGRYLQEGGQLG